MTECSAESPQSLTARLPEITRRFSEAGVLGVLAIDGSFLESIEDRHGDEACQKAHHALAELVRDVAAQRLTPIDLVLDGEIGRNEILVLVFRAQGNASFHRQEVPAFEIALRERLEQQEGNAFYPFLRTPPQINTGSGVCIRNPRLRFETQLAKVIDEARRGAALNADLAARARRQRFMELMLDGQVFSVYEPIVDVGSHTVYGYEALIRGPEDSEFHSPLALFGAAEEYDLIFQLDCLCRLAGLEGAVDFPSGTKLFLNIRPTAIHDPMFRADRIIQTLERSGLRPSDVVFEISEQESIGSFGDFKEIRDEYRQLGFQFALDDTGSGYAGLEALLEISPEFVKMDRAFVSGVDQDSSRQELLKALLTVSEKMGARVIGEGLDTLEELEMLGKLGIHFGQGWLFGRPTPLRAKKK